MLNTRYAPLSQCTSFMMAVATLIGMPDFEFTAGDGTVHKQGVALFLSFSTYACC